jgi:hypothetical protein
MIIFPSMSNGIVKPAGMYFAAVISIGTLGRQSDSAASDVQKLTTHTTRITREYFGCSRGMAQDLASCQKFPAKSISQRGVVDILYQQNQSQR